MRTFKDQTGRKLKISAIPSRVVSLVPSITELLVDLELENEIVGITKFCIHPTHLKENKSIIGGTKNVNIQKVSNLRPDLIIANKEENEKAQIDELSKHSEIYISDVENFEDALVLVNILGIIFNKESRAKQLARQLNVAVPNSIFPKKEVLYLIWRRPFMSIGGDTYIHDILTRSGLSNCCSDQKRYPKLNPEEIKKFNPEYVFLSSEPYPFKENHKMELKSILPNSKIVLVDGEAFSWYGTRILKIEKYFDDLKLKLC